jgi:hypothetical protein
LVTPKIDGLSALPNLTHDAQQPSSAAHQTGGKFAHANLMTGWGVGCMQWLGGTGNKHIVVNTRNWLRRTIRRADAQRQFF